jgi:hypothetical protein
MRLSSVGRAHFFPHGQGCCNLHGFGKSDQGRNVAASTMALRHQKVQRRKAYFFFQAARTGMEVRIDCSCELCGLCYLHICQPILMNGFTFNSIRRPDSRNDHSTRIFQFNKSKLFIPTAIIAFPLRSGDRHGGRRHVPTQQVGSIGIAQP